MLNFIYSISVNSLLNNITTPSKVNLPIQKSTMASTSQANPDANTKPFCKAFKAQALAFIKRMKELDKQCKEKCKESDTIVKLIEGLDTELGHIEDMLTIITNQGLYNTAVDAYNECATKMGAHKVCTSGTTEANSLTVARPGLPPSRTSSASFRLRWRSALRISKWLSNQGHNRITRL